MRVLIACEESQTACIAFRNRGHLAFSCDLQDCSGGHPEWHIKGDCIPIIQNNSWDLIIAHPPCTYLSCVSSVNLIKNGVINEDRLQKLYQAREFFMFFYNLQGVKVCIENPRALARADLPPYSQVIQPYEFGDPYTKLTLLWLKDLPPLIPLCYGERKRSVAGCSSWVATHRGSVQRSKSFPGIANAMAMQWDF